ncbi:hypothetical protein TNCV_1526101 [Trichonephila clavipes]|nr:hypothetical protein TNCV_1526101 [Trichonephila clavipes]
MFLGDAGNSSYEIPLKTRRLGSDAQIVDETSSRWCGVVSLRPRHLTMVQNYVVRRQKPSEQSSKWGFRRKCAESPNRASIIQIRLSSIKSSYFDYVTES